MDESCKLSLSIKNLVHKTFDLYIVFRFIKYIIIQMKAVVNLLESHLQSSVLSPYDEVILLNMYV